MKKTFDFNSLKGVLTRDEMRQVKGGSGPVNCFSCKGLTVPQCFASSGSPCPANQYYVPATNSVCWQCTPN